MFFFNGEWLSAQNILMVDSGPLVQNVREYRSRTCILLSTVKLNARNLYIRLNDFRIFHNASQTLHHGRLKINLYSLSYAVTVKVIVMLMYLKHMHATYNSMPLIELNNSFD